MSEPQAVRLANDFYSTAKNVHGLRVTVDASKKQIEAQEAAIKARARPEVVAEFDKRQAAIRDAQIAAEIKSKAVKGGTK